MKKWAGWFFKCLAWVIASLPQRMREALGVFLGFLWFDVLRIRRRIAIENVGIAFPQASEEERTRIARASLHHMGRTLVEFCQFPFFKEKDVDRFFVFEGLEHVESALKAGRGALLLTCHLGNGDFAIAALSRLRYPVSLISKEFKTRWLNDLWFGMRSKHGTRFIAPEKSSFEILRALRRNGLVLFVLDQFMGPPIGVKTTFFGRETGTAAGLALMASRTGAPVIPCYAFRREDGKHVARFEEPIQPILDRDDSLIENNIAVMTQVYTDKVERIVSRYPEQWMWIHRRWKEFRD